MPTFVYTGDGAKTSFRFPGEAVATTARVDGAIADPASADASTVRFRSAPPIGSLVEIIQRPAGEAGEPGWSLPVTLDIAPLSLTVGAETRFPPLVRYWGSTADAVPFPLDLLAKKIDVMANGTRQVTY